MTPTEKVDALALLQAIGVVAVYAFLKDGIPKIFGKNGNGDDKMTTAQHDKECELKLRPLKEKLDEVHKDFKEYMRSQGYTPPSERD